MMAADSFLVADFRLALRNVFRQKARTALTLSVIGAGVAGLILCGGFVEDALHSLREVTIHSQLGHLQIYKKDFYEKGKRSPFNYLIEKPEEVLAITQAEPEVAATMSRLSFAGILNQGKSDFAILGEGIEPAKEAKLGSQIQIIQGRNLTGDDRLGIMLGEGVAATTGLAPGDHLNLLLNTNEGALNNLEFQVVGVFRTFSQDYDGRVVRIALPDAKELLGSKAVNAIIVELKDTTQTEAVAASLRAKLDGNRFEVKTWFELADFYQKTAALYERQFAFLKGIILLSVLLSVVNSVNMTIFERTGEFGTMMALGWRRIPIIRLVLIENLLVGILGSAVGVLLGAALAALINALQIELPPPPNANGGYFAGIRLAPGIVFTAFIVGFLTTPLAALLPARRIARLPVVDALRMN